MNLPSTLIPRLGATAATPADLDEYHAAERLLRQGELWRVRGEIYTLRTRVRA
jgi:hypothetical protein